MTAPLSGFPAGTCKRIIVKEDSNDVIRKVIDYGRMLRRLIEPS